MAQVAGARCLFVSAFGGRLRHRGFSDPPRSRRLSQEQSGLEEPLPKPIHPLTPYVASQAPPRRFQPVGSFRLTRWTLSRSSHDLIDLFSQDHQTFPVEGIPLA
jgi:hypothetical protein